MSEDDAPKRPRLNADRRRALRAAELQVLVQQYGRKAPKHGEPNDRRYDRKVEKAVKRMRPVKSGPCWINGAGAR